MEVKALSLKNTEYNTVINKSQELTVERNNVLEKFNNISDVNITRLGKVIPDTFDSVLFINDLNNLVAQYGMKIKDFKINEPKTEVLDTIINQPANQAYKTTVVSFKVSGTYAQFTSFLESLESSLRLMDVTNLNIQSYGGLKPGEISLDYIVEVNTYSLR